MNASTPARTLLEAASLGLAAAALGALHGPRFALGVLGGAVVALLDLLLAARAVRSLGQLGAGGWVLLAAFRWLPLGAALWFLLPRSSPAGVLLGLSTVVLAITGRALLATLHSSPPTEA